MALNNKFKGIICLIALTIVLSSCSKEKVIDKSMEANYYSNLEYSKKLSSKIDIEGYRKSMETLLNGNIIYKDYLDKQVKPLKNVTDTLKDTLYVEAERRNKEAIIEDDDEEGWEGALDIYDDVEMTKQEDGEYAIYGDEYNINGYGTKEEAQKAIDEFNKKPTETIKDIDAYNDLLLVRIHNKYFGLRVIGFKLVDGKIDSIEEMVRFGEE